MQFSLRDLVEKRNDLTLIKITTILNDVCLGLQYLHSRTPPIVHRDLTPNNILLCYHFRAKITDLGVARTLQATDTKTLTQAPGTDDFMPPEYLVDQPVYGLPLDIFSFGGIILYITTQQWPQPVPWMSVSINSDKKLTPTSELRPRQQYLNKMIGTFVNLKPLVISCLDDNPKNRPTVAEILVEIKKIINAFSEAPEYWVSEQVQVTTKSQKQQKRLPHHQQRRQEMQHQPQLCIQQEQEQQQRIAQQEWQVWLQPEEQKQEQQSQQEQQKKQEQEEKQQKELKQLEKQKLERQQLVLQQVII